MFSFEKTFSLSDEFINKYKGLKEPFGFNGLGELVYYRTYSRKKEDGSSERWFETVRRVVECIYSIQQQHAMRNNIDWNRNKAVNSVKKMYDHIFNMRFTPPGRGLWALTPDILRKAGGAALNNCSFISTAFMANSIEEAVKPFTFLMDMSMLGVGVGFDTRGRKSIVVNKPYPVRKKNIVGKVLESFCPHSKTFVIPDTREGWVESIKVLLNSYFAQHFDGKRRKTVVFDYSQIRPYGSPIKTFGGVASGPDPLRELHENVRKVLDKNSGKAISTTTIVDIQNMIGCCVVAGNVRRSAEIALGDADDKEFRKLKDYQFTDKGIEGSAKDRVNWAWASNNSVYCRVGMDYTELSMQTAKNGEPGYFWLENVQNYGRMIDGFKAGIDGRAVGTNPCSEQSLEHGELCCLVETYPSRCKDNKEYFEVLKYAYLYAKTVTLVPTHEELTNSVIRENRRIGTSMTGVTNYIEMYGMDALKELCEQGYQTVQKYDEVYSNWFKINRSIKTTSIKPSGTVSLLAGVSPGMHYPEANYYIRRIRIAQTSPLVNVYMKAGYEVEDDVVSKGTSVISIPIHVEGKTINDVDITTQVELAVFLQKYWADNQVSVTITFKDGEEEKIEELLEEYDHELKSISFLKKTEIGVFPQMPYEEITEEKYNEMMSRTKPLSFTFADTTIETLGEKFCDNSTCNI